MAAICLALATLGTAGDGKQTDESALHAAAKAGNTAQVGSLLDAGTSVNAVDGLGDTALHVAARWGRNAVVTMLIAKGADVNARNRHGYTPLHVAAYGKSDVPTIEVLVAKGATVNAQNAEKSTPLHLAAMSGHTDKLLALIKMGADVSACDNSGMTPLHQAAMHNRREAAEALIAAGADASAADYVMSATPWDLAKDDPLRALLRRGALTSRLILAAAANDKMSARYCLEQGANISGRDAYGWTALHYGVKNHNKGVVQLLLAKGSFINAQGKNGKTPLDVAEESGDEEIAAMLRQRGGKRGDELKGQK